MTLFIIMIRNGFIAGTTNPFFKQSCNYFLLVDLNEGTVSHKKNAIESSTPKRRLKRLGSKAR